MDITAEKFLETLNEIRPNIFSCIYKDINPICWARENWEEYCKYQEEHYDELADYKETENIHIATAIIKDFGKDKAKSIAKIILAATE